MPILSGRSTNHWIVFIKILLISTGVLFLAMVAKLSVPVVSDFVVSEVPSIWGFFISCLRPPYLYLLINCIIVSIVASSKLQNKQDDQQETVLNGYGYGANENAEQKVSVGFYGRALEKESDEKEVTVAMDSGHEAVISSPISSGLQRKDSVEMLFLDKKEKPLVSSRFGHRKAVKPSPEGKPLGVSKPKRNDTLDTTWRKITEGRSVPLSRHLKKSDMWASHARDSNPPDDENTQPNMKKSETFNGRNNGANSSLGREPSLSQDELNRRVEAFIKKFNEEMRMQRQESLNQYREMISIGAR